MPNRLWQFDVFAAFLKAPLVGQERLALHEEQREGGHSDIRHGIGHVTAAPLVRKARARRPHAIGKGLKNLHDPLESCLATAHHP